MNFVDIFVDIFCKAIVKIISYINVISAQLMFSKCIHLVFLNNVFHITIRPHLVKNIPIISFGPICINTCDIFRNTTPNGHKGAMDPPLCFIFKFCSQGSELICCETCTLMITLLRTSHVKIQQLCLIKGNLSDFYKIVAQSTIPNTLIYQ